MKTRIRKKYVLPPIEKSEPTTWKARLLHYRQQAGSGRSAQRPYDWLSQLARQARIPQQLGDARERTLMYERLQVLCEELQRIQFLRPTRTTFKHYEEITVMGVAGYRIDRRRKSVSGFRNLFQGDPTEGPFIVDLLHPLCTSAWLQWLILDLRLTDTSPQGDLFRSRQQTKACDEWLAKTAYGLLLTDPRFCRLRSQEIPRWLGLDADLVRIALKSRYLLKGVGLTSSLYSIVWRYESLFRRVEQENPKLLPLLAIFIIERFLPLKEDPIKEMRAFCLFKGLSKAAWRYLVRHGARLFYLPWQLADNPLMTQTALEYLRILDEAKLPHPPSPAVIRTLLQGAINVETGKIYYAKNWCPIGNDILSIILHHAAKLRESGVTPEFIDSLRGIVLWAKEVAGPLDSNQQHAGWPWLERQTRQWSETQGLLIKANDMAWHSAVQSFRVSAYLIEPLCSERTLVAEGIAMRNCIATYASDCALNRNRLFLVRNRDTKKRVMHIGLSREGDRLWTVFEAAGYANRTVTKELMALARVVAQRYSRADAPSQGSSGGTLKDPGEKPKQHAA